MRFGLKLKFFKSRRMINQSLIFTVKYFRRFMIGKIASHLADFSPRLRSNTKALYQVSK